MADKKMNMKAVIRTAIFLTSLSNSDCPRVNSHDLVFKIKVIVPHRSPVVILQLPVAPHQDSPITQFKKHSNYSFGCIIMINADRTNV